MIRRLNPYLAAVLAASSLALALPAQANPMGRHGGHEAHQMGGHGMRALRGLDLTQEQRDQVFKLFHAQAPALRDRMQAARGAQRELRKIARSPSFDAARARELADAAGKAHADVALMRAESMSKVIALLTPEQRAKLEEARERGPRGGRR